MGEPKVIAIEVSRQINRPPEDVWRVISDLADHPSWMGDAHGLEFTTEQTRGVGTLMRVPTKVGPIHTVDILEVVEWVEGSYITVDHQGRIGGTGRLAVIPADQGALVAWTETLRFPWWLGGRLTAWAARPVLAIVWRRNLLRLELLFSSQ